MTPDERANLDARVLQAIQAGHVKAEHIRKELGCPPGLAGAKMADAIGRSLTRLRKADKIRYIDSGWAAERMRV